MIAVSPAFIAERLACKMAVESGGDRGFDFRVRVADGVIEVTRRSTLCRGLHVDSEYEGVPVRVVDSLPGGGRE